MNTRPTLTNRKLWQRRRAHYFAVLKGALMLLRQRGPLPEEELELNRQLQWAIVTARLALDPNGEFGAPVFEAQSLPDPDANTKQPHEHKIPDAQWRHDDPRARDHRHVEKSFHIECKRLGLTTPAGWKLNENYVNKGMERFQSLTHRYGMHMAEGAMIGYVQSMGLPTVYADVCKHASIMQMSLPVPVRGWQPQGVTELAHSFTRGYAVSPFGLTHLWLDIQDIPTRPRSVRAPKSATLVPTKSTPSARSKSSRRSHVH